MICKHMSAVCLCLCLCSMRNNFLPFSSGANNTIYLQRSSKALPTSDVLDEKEDDFIAGAHQPARLILWLEPTQGGVVPHLCMYAWVFPGSAWNTGLVQ